MTINAQETQVICVAEATTEANRNDMIHLTTPRANIRPAELAKLTVALPHEVSGITWLTSNQEALKALLTAPTVAPLRAL